MCNVTLNINKFDNIVKELNLGNRENLYEFIEYAYSIYRHQPSSYNKLILNRYQFHTPYYKESLEWMQEIMKQHMFSKYFFAYCIFHENLNNNVHWKWKYVQGMGDDIPVDCAVIIHEGNEELLVWVEYDEDDVIQPLAPFASFTYSSVQCFESYQCDRYLIYTLHGFDTIRDRELEIDLRSYHQKSHDSDKKPFYHTGNSLEMAENFSQMFNNIKGKHADDSITFTSDEIDALLIAQE